ncbi:basic amino acid ABC transporter substrate-binding protein [Marispirochaeta aestuarii]|uniref:basic amino acid ABC transporter substrate-binding protein n=1 Tax=Marispirochaeta aestuarii TaxID=1963862 RepID=UPI0029C75938|nr:basic amino acid ABC transporter substrate-binding protein [Marispirochaeta aestuarii]
MFKRIALVFMISLIGFALFAGGQQDDNMYVFASDVAWAPMEFVDENGDMVGFDIDLMAAIAEEAGFEYEIRNTAWDGIFAGLANGAYDGVISSVTITDDRKKAMDFSEPYINAGQVLIVRKELNGVTTLADMKGMKVGVQNGTTGDFAVEDAEGVERRAYDEIGFAVEDLMNGNVDGVVCDSPVAADYVLQNENYQGALKIVGEPFTEEYYGIAVQKGNTELLNKINTGLKKVIESGKRDELIDKWLR